MLLLLTLAGTAWFVLVVMVIALCRAAAAGDEMSPRRRGVRFAPATALQRQRPTVLR